MNPLLVVLPFHNGDLELAKRLLGWMAELKSNNAPHSLLVAYDASVPADQLKEIGALARACNFSVLKSLSLRVEDKDWRAPNTMFFHISRHIQHTMRVPFLWLEPDSVPLTPNWLDNLARAYDTCPTLYMGAFIKCSDPGLPPLHMTGCGIYPNHAHDLLAKFCDAKAENAWDMGMATEMCVNGCATDTKLIQHFYGQKDLAPTFVLKKEAGQEHPINCLDVGFLSQSASIFHRCKDGTLIPVLRELRKSATVAKSKPETATK